MSDARKFGEALARINSFVADFSPAYGTLDRDRIILLCGQLQRDAEIVSAEMGDLFNFDHKA
jgi:hypothetical protein